MAIADLRYRWRSLGAFWVSLTGSNSEARCLSVIGYCLVVGLVQPRFSQAQEIWFSPRSAPEYAAEFDALFDSEAPWQRAASHIKAFEVSIQFETASPEIRQKRLIDALQEHRIQLALDMLPLTGRSAGPASRSCGYNVEGYAASPQSLAMAKHFKALGANVAYFDMDEPLFYGHFYKGTNACHSSIEDLIADVADKVKQVRGQYPAVEIGETEPIVAVAKFGTADLEKWLDTFQIATGKPLSFLRLDINWTAEWRPAVMVVARLLKRREIPLQVIYNGSDHDQSDREWIANALANATAFESIAQPAAVVIQSWTAYPKRFLPETDPSTMTGFIDRYLATRVKR